MEGIEKGESIQDENHVGKQGFVCYEWIFEEDHVRETLEEVLG